MMRQSLNRRRTLTIMAAACATAAVPARSAASRHVWKGPVLGGDGKLIFDGLDRGMSQTMVALAVAEIDRLEQIFSLYLPNSEISRLNRERRLTQPTHDFQTVLAASLDVWQRSDGAFNPAIQPLWQGLREHFADDTKAADPAPEQLLTLLKRCDPARIGANANGISLEPGMALTLNGIAQGYIADKVTALLHQHGLRNTLVQLGETRALPGREWRIAVEGTGRYFSLHDGAVATSAGRGTRFTRDGRWHHLIDPLTGRSRNDFASVTVRAPTALQADAISTALGATGGDSAMRILRRFPQAGAIVQYASGDVVDLGGQPVSINGDKG